MRKSVGGIWVHILMILLLLSAMGCGPSLIRTDGLPGAGEGFGVDESANIIDSEENRALLEVLSAYRTAIIKRDTNSLRQLVSSSYFENGSTTNNREDDYGNEKLEDIYADLTEIVQEVRYDVKVWEVVHDAPNIAHIDYEHMSSFRFRTDGRDVWQSKRDVNRLTFVLENDQWKIASGL